MGLLLFFIRSKMYAIGQPDAGVSANALLAALYGGCGGSHVSYGKRVQCGE